MTGKEIIKILEQYGWYLVRIKDSHHIMKKDGALPTVIPVHGKKDIKPGLLRSIERSTGVKFKK